MIMMQDDKKQMNRRMEKYKLQGKRRKELIENLSKQYDISVKDIMEIEDDIQKGKRNILDENYFDDPKKNEDMKKILIELYKFIYAPIKNRPKPKKS